MDPAPKDPTIRRARASDAPALAPRMEDFNASESTITVARALYARAGFAGSPRILMTKATPPGG